MTIDTSRLSTKYQPVTASNAAGWQATPPRRAVWVLIEGLRRAFAGLAKGATASPSAVASFVLALAYGTGLWLHVLHQVGGAAERHEPHTLLHWLRDSTLTLPLVYVAVWIGLVLAGRLLKDADQRVSRLMAGSVTAASVALTTSLAVAAAGPVHGLLFGAHHPGNELPLVVHLARDGLMALVANLVLAAAVCALFSWQPRRATQLASGLRFWRRYLVPAVHWTTVAALLIGLLPPVAATVPGQLFAPSTAQAADNCSAGAAHRSYGVEAVSVDIPFNRWGDHNPNGQLYVLSGDKAAVQNWYVPLDDPASPGPRRLRPRPLVLRANEGECVEVKFKNELSATPGEGLAQNPRASMHVHGPSYNVQTSDGSWVGWNENTTVPIGSSITYYWRAPSKEGLYYFHDHGNLAGSEADGGSNVHGLYGAFVVEPAGSIWLDPASGNKLYTDSNASSGGWTGGTTSQSGELYIDAVIVPPAAQGNAHNGSVPDLHGPNEVAFRESIQISQDEIPSVGLGFNFGVEPLLLREDPINRCPDCLSEETWLSSWPYGDPALVKLASGKGPWYPTWHALYPGNGGQPNPSRVANPEDCGIPTGCYTSNVTHAYKFDAIKIRFAHAGPKETHVFHLHAHQWLSDPFDVGNTGSTPGQPGAPPNEPKDVNARRPQAATIDSQTFGPSEGFTADLLFGAGSKPGTIGDSIFHCHLYPHFAEGFWSLLRVHDVLEDGSGTTPDGVLVRSLTALPDRVLASDVPPASTEFNPGFPRYLPGQFGWRAPQPLDGVSQHNGSADVPDTVAREDLQSAIRIVAGKGLYADLLQKTQSIWNNSAAVNEVQTIFNTASDGTFTLSFGPETTAPLPYNASAAQMKAVLEALVDITEVTVTGSGTAADPWVVTFLNPGGTNVDQLVAVDSFPSPGSTTVTTTTQGANGGTFRLTFGAETTDSIAFNASAAQVEAALKALTGIVNATVTGAGTQSDPWKVRLGLWSKVPSLVLTATDTLTSGTTTISPDPALVGPDAAKMAYQLAIERNVSLINYNPGYDPANPPSILKLPKPGAPVVDPCPAGAREVTYNVSIIQRDIVYNEAGWHDPQGRFLVLDQDVNAILAGTKAPEPLFFRVNAGDCINFNLTNRLPNWVGNDDFLELVQTNMVGQHIHLVKFDVTASDGASNGWNNQQAAFSEEQAEFNEQVLAGTQPCAPDTLNGTEAVGGGCRVPPPPSFPADWQCGSVYPCPRGQTFHERWYADYELRTVFTHDHHFPAIDQNRGYFGALVVEPTSMDVRNSFTGQYLQPINDAAHGKACGSACVGTAAGTHLDIIGPGLNDDFREFSLAIQDFVSLYRPCTSAGGCSSVLPGQEPLNPPTAPEGYPDDDPGIFGVNYRNAPFLLRDKKNGVPVDPAYRFSSYVFGDPATPLLQAYSGDPIRVRLIQGAQEEQHVMQLHGMRWLDEPDDPGSPLVNSRSLGISEAFNFEIPRMECGVNEDCRGDYLYSGTSTDDLYLGVWGILRVFGRSTSGLLPLPDNVPQNLNGNVNLNSTGNPPPMANKPGNSCPTDAPLRSYQVIALDARLTYNEFEDQDPYGLVYAVMMPGETPAQAAARVRASNPEPMVLRANEGDCIEVNLTNLIDPSGRFAQEHGPLGAHESNPWGADPPLPLEPLAGTPAGLRVSLHAALVRYDIRGSDGATIGFNRDQTVGPGESILYRWHADDVTPGELGAINLTDYGDVRGHRHHGLFAGLVIHPKNATYHDPLTGAEILSGAQATIRVPGRPDNRDFTLFFQDGLNLRDKDGAPLVDAFDHPPTPEEPIPAMPDSEDRGEKGFNYRTESFNRRLGLEPGAALDGITNGALLANVFSSEVHGDPWTPIFRAYAGDPVWMRVLQGADKPRQHTVQVSGHGWLRQPFDEAAQTEFIGASGGFSVGRALNLRFEAGGPDHLVGDYKYNCGVFFHHQSGGLWGILRVYPVPAAAPVYKPNALQPLDSPYQAGYHPLLPLEQVEITAGVYDDGNMNGARSQSENPVADVTVKLKTTDGTVLATKITDANGHATFQASQGAYDVEIVVPSDWAATTPTWYRADGTGENVRVYGELGLVQLADVAVRVFNDKNGDQAFGTGEVGLNAWSVSLVGDGQTRTATSNVDGLVTFDGLKPGSYTANVVAQAGWFPTRKLPVTFSVAENASLQPPSDVQVGFTLKSGLSAKLFNDSDGDSAQDSGESSLAGWEVTASGGPADFPITVKGTTNSNGVVTFDDPDPTLDGLRAGTYTVSAAPHPDWSCSTGSSTATDPEGTTSVAPTSCAAGSYTTILLDQTTQVVSMAYRNPNVWVAVVPFNDTNSDGTRQDKESKLVGWEVRLYQADGTTPAIPTGAASNRAVTGNDGRAAFYPLPPGTYRVKMSPPPPSPDPTVLDWTATTPADVPLTIIAGETGTSRFGFVQLGTAGAVAFHDYDQDGVWDDNEAPLANRNVRLYEKTGKTLLAQGVTDAGGRFAFKVSAGQEYQLEVLLPVGWTATAPVGTNGSGMTRAKVKGPSGTTSVEVQYGQYAQNDVTPPPAPQAEPATGAYEAPLTVALTSETGAVIRYTLNGSDPTATTGTVYSGPITIASSMTLKAIAIDGAGNLSAVVTETYTINGDTTPPPAPLATPPGGTYNSTQVVTLASEAGATIRYTLDGTGPTATTGTVYVNPITIASSMTLKAVAIDIAGNVSTVTTASYKISNDTTPPPAPQATPPGGTYDGPQTVMLTSEAGASIRYTLDGSDPAKRSGKVYDGPITIGESATLKAVAIDGASNVSAMTTQVYTVVLPTAPTVTATPTATATPRSKPGKPTSKAETVGEAAATPPPATPTATPASGATATPTLVAPTATATLAAPTSPPPSAAPTATPGL